MEREENDIVLHGRSDNEIIDAVLKHLNRGNSNANWTLQNLVMIPRERKNAIHAKLYEYGLIEDSRRVASVGNFIKISRKAIIILNDFGSFSKSEENKQNEKSIFPQEFYNLIKTSDLMKKKQDLKEYQHSVKSIKGDIESLKNHYNTQLTLAAKGQDVNLAFTLNSINKKEKDLILCEQAVELLESQIQVETKNQSTIMQNKIENHYHIGDKISGNAVHVETNINSHNKSKPAPTQSESWWKQGWWKIVVPLGIALIAAYIKYKYWN